MAAYNITFGCDFLGTKSAGMDRVGCGEDDWGNNNKQKDERSWIYIWECVEVLIAMIWQCMDFIIYMCVEKMRYPEIHKNKINQCSYWFSDPHRTNLLWHNNQPRYRSNIWWLFVQRIILSSVMLWFIVFVHIKLDEQSWDVEVDT